MGILVGVIGVRYGVLESAHVEHVNIITFLHSLININYLKSSHTCHACKLGNKLSNLIELFAFFINIEVVVECCRGREYGVHSDRNCRKMR